MEAEIRFIDDTWGRGSSATAILPGKREKEQSDKLNREKIKSTEEMLNDQIRGKAFNQCKLDRLLKENESILGSDICLSVSLAFAHAAANYRKISFTEYLRDEMQEWLNQPMNIPILLVPVLSGGVHNQKRRDSFQQIMISLKGDSMWEVCEAAKEISRITHLELDRRGIAPQIATTGGYLANELTTSEQIQLVQDIMDKEAKIQAEGIAIDVAGEHLYWEACYHLDGSIMEKSDFLQIMTDYVQRFSISYLEDPFDTGDIQLWKNLKNNLSERTAIIGDDIFATQVEHIDHDLADGAVIKMNQVGTLSGTLQAIRFLKKNRMLSCVSHRSYETEDTTLCDLAVAAASDFIKIGGVTRGERIIKYNQLLRLESLLYRKYH